MTIRVFLTSHVSGGVYVDGIWKEYGGRLQELTLPEDEALDLIRQGVAVAAMEPVEED